jgi:hypothetical protein
MSSSIIGPIARRYIGATGPRISEYARFIRIDPKDWTRAFAAVNYERAIEPFLKADRRSGTERAILMGAPAPKLMAGRQRKLRADPDKLQTFRTRSAPKTMR